MTESEIDELARKIWDYHHLNQRLERSEVILALGSMDLRVADHAASLYLHGWAPRLVCSGNVGTLTKGLFAKSEAETFAEIALRKGVPPEAILLEVDSTNTGQNIIFTRRLLEDRGLDPESFILVQKPYMERRAYATFMKFWPGKRVIAASPPVSFEQYATAELPKELVINILVGDLQRIKLYPSKGFQIEQEIPAEVWDAFQQLVAAGYTSRLVEPVR